MLGFNLFVCFVGFIDKALRDGDEIIGYHVWQHAHLPTFSLKGNTDIWRIKIVYM